VIFSLANVSVHRSGRVILDAVELTLEPGKIIVVVGPNGAGKTTLLKILCGEINPDQGQVALDGRRLSDWPSSELAEVRAVLPQTSTLAFPFTVYEVAALGMISNPASFNARQRATLPSEMLRQVGLEGLAKRFYQTLSGGEQQRVQMARVLCQVPEANDGSRARWLFLDEPTSNLDISHQFAILQIARARAHAGGGVFTILHDLNMAALFADRLIVLSEGRVAADGTPSEVLTNEMIEEVFKVPLRVGVVPSPRTAPFVLPHSAVENMRLDEEP